MKFVCKIAKFCRLIGGGRSSRRTRTRSTTRSYGGIPAAQEARQGEVRQALHDLLAKGRPAVHGPRSAIGGGGGAPGVHPNQDETAETLPCQAQVSRLSPICKKLCCTLEHGLSFMEC